MTRKLQIAILLFASGALIWPMMQPVEESAWVPPPYITPTWDLLAVKATNTPRLPVASPTAGRPTNTSTNTPTVEPTPEWTATPNDYYGLAQTGSVLAAQATNTPTNTPTPRLPKASPTKEIYPTPRGVN